MQNNRRSSADMYLESSNCRFKFTAEWQTLPAADSRSISLLRPPGSPPSREPSPRGPGRHRDQQLVPILKPSALSTTDPWLHLWARWHSPSLAYSSKSRPPCYYLGWKKLGDSMVPLQICHIGPKTWFATMLSSRWWVFNKCLLNYML